MSNSPLVVVIQYRSQLGAIDRTKQELGDLVAQVLKNEAGCLSLRMHQGIDDPTRFLLYERWKDRATFEGPHMKTPYIQAFIERAAEFLAGPPDISFYWETGSSEVSEWP